MNHSNQPPLFLIIILCTVFFVILLAGLFFLFTASGSRKLLRQRMDMYLHRTNVSSVKDNRADVRRKQINSKLRSLKESKKHSKSRYGAARKYIIQAGLDISLSQYWLLCLSLGVVSTIIYGLTGYNRLFMPVVFLLFTYIVPRKILKRKAAKRQKLFTKHFSDAVDVLVRGLKSGLPVGECFRIIARESPDPVGSEFRVVLDENYAGLTMQEALERCYERMPTHEVRFFATVIAIQSQTGGNLAEILGNISMVLRGRAQLKEKIKALSGEAKASSAIIGCLPFLVGGALAFLNPDYISLLFNTSSGNILLAVAMGMLSFGVWIMNKMGQLDM